MANENDLTTLNTVQDFLGSGDNDITIINKLITAASVWINGHTDRKLKSRIYSGADDDTLYDGNGSNQIFLTQYPVITITGVYEDTDRVFGTDTLIDSGDYVCYKNRGKLVYTENTFVSGYQTIKVLYTAGYEAVPYNLETATLILIDYWYKKFSDHAWGVSSVGVEDKRIAYELGVPKQIKEMLEEFCKKVVM